MFGEIVGIIVRSIVNVGHPVVIFRTYYGVAVGSTVDNLRYGHAVISGIFLLVNDNSVAFKPLYHKLAHTECIFLYVYFKSLILSNLSYRYGCRKSYLFIRINRAQNFNFYVRVVGVGSTLNIGYVYNRRVSRSPDKVGVHNFSYKLEILIARFNPYRQIRHIDDCLRVGFVFALAFGQVVKIIVNVIVPT